jgi:hypothetical protein
MSDPQLPISEQHIPIARAIDYRFASPAAQRPGLVTAVGIISIVVAGLGMFANLFMGMQALVMIAVARMPPAALAPPPPAPVTTPVNAPGTDSSSDDDLSGRGYSSATRAAVIDVLAELEPLSDQRRSNLNAVLKKAGKDVFPFDDRDVTPARIRSAVTEVGRKPFGTHANYFILGTGRLEVDDGEAVFTPWSGDGQVTSGAPELPGGPTVIAGAAPPAPPANPFAGLSTTAAWLAVIDAILSEALAVFLLICGILVLRNSPRGGRMHWIYVGLKLPLVILTALAWGWLYASMIGGLGGGGAVFGTVGAIYAIMFAMMSGGYPFALLFALRARSVREFYTFGSTSARSPAAAEGQTHA